jgi:hypothetical protein
MFLMARLRDDPETVVTLMRADSACGLHAGCRRSRGVEAQSRKSPSAMVM